MAEGRGPVWLVLLIGSAVLAWVGGGPAGAQAGRDDTATVEVAGEYISTSALTELIFEGPGPHEDEAAYSRDPSPPSRLEITDDGRIVTADRDPVRFQRQGATITYTRRFPDNYSCALEDTEEIVATADAVSRYTLTVVETDDEGRATRLALRTELDAPYASDPDPSRGTTCPVGSVRAVYTGEWVRVQGASAVASSEDGALTVAVLADLEPLEVEAGDDVVVPLAVTGVRTPVGPCAPVPPPFEGPLTLDSIVLATSGGGGGLLATTEEPSPPRGTTVEFGTPFAVTTDAPGPCSYRQVVELVVTLRVPAGTPPGEYPVSPNITGLPALASADASELVLTVVERRTDPEAASPGGRRVSTVEGEFASNVGDVGNRSALAAILLAAVAAIFSRTRGRRLRALGIFAGTVALGAGAIELFAGGLLGDVDVGEHVGSGAFSAITGMAVAGGFGFFLPWLSRPDRDDRQAGPLVPLALGVWVFALRALDGADIGRAVVAGVIACVIGLIAVTGRSRTRARAFGLVAGTTLMVLTYLGAVVGDGSDTGGTIEVVIGLALAGVALLIAVFVPDQPRASEEPEAEPESALPGR